MPQSLTRLLAHIIFSTKDRIPCIGPEIRRELYPYSATVLANLQCPPIKIGGTGDHIHILCLMSKTITVAKLVEGIKVPTSRWLKTKGVAFGKFSWQNGYGAFSIGQSAVDRVEAYIAGQEEHHQRVSFKDEFRRFLKRYRVEYDERYVWD